jgi:outer membrane protein TolC
LCIILPFPYLSEAGADTGQELLTKRVLRLSLEEGKIMVLQKNLDIAIEQIVPRVEEARIDREKGIFDPEITGELQREDSDTPLSNRSSVAAGGINSAESEAYNLSTSISGKIPLGTEYSLEFEDIRTENTFNRFDAEYDSFAGIKITQPLLKNFGHDANRFNIHIAQKNRDISVSDLKQRIIDTVAEFKKAYWDMVLVIEDLKVKKESLRLAESLLDLNRKRLKAEVVSPLEVTQAEAGMAARKEDVIIAQKVLKEKENALKRLISDDIYEIRSVEILPTDVPVVVPVNLDPEAGFREGLQNRPDYRNAKIEIEKKDISIQYAENQKFPSIDLEASYGYNGLGNSFSDSLSGMDDNPEWTLGVMIKIPLGNRSANGDLKIAKLEAKQALLNLKKLEQEILVEVYNSIQELEANKKRIEATKISKKLAEESLRAEELKLREGLSTSHNVLDFQEDLAEAGSREISAVIDYNKSLVEFSRVKGAILEEEGINLYEK